MDLSCERWLGFISSQGERPLKEAALSLDLDIRQTWTVHLRCTSNNIHVQLRELD